MAACTAACCLLPILGLWDSTMDSIFRMVSSPLPESFSLSRSTGIPSSSMRWKVICSAIYARTSFSAVSPQPTDSFSSISSSVKDSLVSKTITGRCSFCRLTIRSVRQCVLPEPLFPSAKKCILSLRFSSKTW